MFLIPFFHKKSKSFSLQQKIFSIFLLHTHKIPAKKCFDSSMIFKPQFLHTTQTHIYYLNLTRINPIF